MGGAVDKLARRCALVIFDVDGVLTDGSIAYTDQGHEIKCFHAQDGSAIKRLQANGIEVALITGRESPMVERRARELGISHLHAGIDNKADAVDRLLETLGLEAGACAYVGDDLPDLAAFERVGLAIAVPNGQPEVRQAAHHVTARPGGAGAASDVCRLILGARER